MSVVLSLLWDHATFSIIIRIIQTFSVEWNTKILTCVCVCYHSAPEHSVAVMPEREKEPDWKTGNHHIGTRNRNRCCNGSKSETPKPGESTEIPLRQNGGHIPVAISFLSPFEDHSPHIFFFTRNIQVWLWLFWQVCAPVALGGSVRQSGVAAVACASRALTLAAHQAAFGPAEGAGAAGAAPAAWKETRTPTMPAHMPALPQTEKVKTNLL